MALSNAEKQARHRRYVKAAIKVYEKAVGVPMVEMVKLVKLGEREGSLPEYLEKALR